jgi:hypothetical protein
LKQIHSFLVGVLVSHYSDKISDINNLTEERFSLVHGFSHFSLLLLDSHEFGKNIMVVGVGVGGNSSLYCFWEAEREKEQEREKERGVALGTRYNLQGHSPMT